MAGERLQSSVSFRVQWCGFRTQPRAMEVDEELTVMSAIAWKQLLEKE